MCHADYLIGEWSFQMALPCRTKYVMQRRVNLYRFGFDQSLLTLLIFHDIAARNGLVFNPLILQVFDTLFIKAYGMAYLLV